MGEKSIDQDLKISRNKYKTEKSMWSKILKSTRQIKVFVSSLILGQKIQNINMLIQAKI